MGLITWISKGLEKRLIDYTYPVGSIFQSTTPTNPSEYFGGTWEPFAEGRVLIGAGTGNDGTTSMSFTAGGLYGLYKHVMTKEEIAKHKHQYTAKWVSEAPSNTGIFGMFGEGKEYTYGGGVEPVGESTPFDIIQPSVGVYIWKRVS